MLAFPNLTHLTGVLLIRTAWFTKCQPNPYNSLTILFLTYAVLELSLNKRREGI